MKITKVPLSLCYVWKRLEKGGESCMHIEPWALGIGQSLFLATCGAVVFGLAVCVGHWILDRILEFF